MSDKNSHQNGLKKRVRYGPDMRILIIGGGIAGLTLAGLLLKRGFNPKLIERTPQYSKVGYVIVLWPSGSRILKGLGVYEKLLEEGCQFTSYYVSNYKGEVLKTYTIDPVAEKYGPIISVYRPDLIDTLMDAVDPEIIKMNTTVEKIEQGADEAEVHFNNGKSEKYDLVIGCDGLRSRTRSQIFGDIPLTYSGMSGWGFWADPNLSKSDGILEYWGKGKFFGIWPTKGKLSVFTSVNMPENNQEHLDTRIQRIKECFKDFGGVVPQILEQLSDPKEIYFDTYNDLKLNSWSKGRVVLVGDSAHAILPNTGAGASMAMESATVIAEDLCRADSKYIVHALKQYESRRKPRVNKVQNQSRMMGKLVYSNSILLSTVRDYVLKVYSNDLVYKYWDNLLRDPI
jgi:2-polyprenyl-6-methoxyphenol hydroxylase-like FAD-dependent oxidoreductase